MQIQRRITPFRWHNWAGEWGTYQALDLALAAKMIEQVEHNPKMFKTEVFTSSILTFASTCWGTWGYIVGSLVVFLVGEDCDGGLVFRGVGNGDGEFVGAVLVGLWVGKVGFRVGRGRQLVAGNQSAMSFNRSWMSLLLNQIFKRRHRSLIKIFFSCCQLASFPAATPYLSEYKQLLSILFSQWGGNYRKVIISSFIQPMRLIKSNRDWLSIALRIQ